MQPNRKISLELRNLHNLIRRQADASETKQYLDKITHMHGWVIGYLCEHRGQDIYQRDLETTFRMRPSTATVILQSMVKAGLLKKEPVRGDARLKKLVLTPHGEALNAQVEQHIAETEEKLTRGLTPEELGEFFRLLDKIKHNAE